MSDEAPKPIRLKGGMTTSKVSGNGWWFHHDSLLGMVSDQPDAPYVIDHGTGLSDVAGQVDRIFVQEEGTIELDIVSGPDKGKKKPWRYLTLGHESSLHPGYPAFEAAKGHILATSKAGKMPQESISFQIGGISYDQETDQVIFHGGFRIVHHSIVSRGAFGPDVGVGVTSIEMSAGGHPVSIERSGPASFGPALVANLEEQVAAFSAANAGNPAALAAIARVSGLPAAAAGATPAASNKEHDPSPPQGKPPGASPMDPPPNPAGAGAGTQLPPAMSKAELDAAISAQVEARFNAAKAEREAIELAAKRQSIVDAYGAEQSIVDAMDAKGLAAFEAHLRNQQSQGIVLAKAKPDARQTESQRHFAAMEAERQAWVKSIAIAKEA